MLEQLEAAYGDLTFAEEWDVLEEESAAEEEILASYEIQDRLLVQDSDSGESDEETHYTLWERFVWLVPSDYRNMLTGFKVFTHADTLAYMVQDEEDAEGWIYAANENQPSTFTEQVMTDVHEFGHLLSLNATQVDPYISEEVCNTYMLDEGCANENSLIYRFYQQFWEQGGSSNEEDYVTEYARENLYEDFAESWTYFVLTARPIGETVVEQKILFFYEEVDLIRLRADILGRAAAWLERQNG